LANAPIDTRFLVPRMPVAVVAIGAADEAWLVRAILESLGAVVTLHLPGTPEDVLLVLGQGEPAPPYLVLCGHGDEQGFVLGEFGAEIDTSALVGESLPPAAMAARAHLPNRIVISTACATGTAAFADAVLGGGVAAYIAPDGYPSGASVPLFIHLLFHQLLVRGASLEAAWRRAAGYDDETRAFVLAAKSGTIRWSATT
jgi:hypothetical protein